MSLRVNANGMDAHGVCCTLAGTKEVELPAVPRTYEETPLLYPALGQISTLMRTKSPHGEALAIGLYRDALLLALKLQDEVAISSNVLSLHH